MTAIAVVTIILTFTQAYFPDPLQLLFKILVRQDGTAAFYAFIIHHIGFDSVLLDDCGRPLAELNGTLGVDLVTDRDDGREVIVLGVVVFAISGTYSKISNN